MGIVDFFDAEPNLILTAIITVNAADTAQIISTICLEDQ